MRNLRIAVAAALLALSLGGCAFLQKAEGVVSAISGATVSPQAIIIAASAYDVVEATAKNYIDPRLNPRCDGVRFICRDPKATVAINRAVREGRKARNAAKQFLRDHPGQLGTQGMLDALNVSTSTLQSIFTQYNIGGGQ